MTGPLLRGGWTNAGLHIRDSYGDVEIRAFTITTRHRDRILATDEEWRLFLHAAKSGLLDRILP